MSRAGRGESIDPRQIQIVHCHQRCVRGEFLCGFDPRTRRSYEHRRGWIRDRLEFLASNFGIDCLTYSVMGNHFHLVLRSRPDVVEVWSDREVARRWLTLCPGKTKKKGQPDAEPPESAILETVGDTEKLEKLRLRLSNISWWMKLADQYIARRSNLEDELTGHFWQGRFKSQVLLDEAGLLACAAYVDLNPIRAAMAETPEQSEYTGAKDRLDDLVQPSDPAPIDAHAWEREGGRQRSGWLSPIEIDETSDPLGPDVSPTRRRASQKGFLSISMLNYLQLIDWTGRQLRADKRGSIPEHLAPLLKRIGLDASGWCNLVTRFGQIFKRAAGTAESLQAEASRRGQGWMQPTCNPLNTAV